MKKDRPSNFRMFASGLLVIGATALTPAFVRPAAADTSVTIGSIPAMYSPENHPSSREPVSVSGYHFEVNLETQRARVVVEYTYPDQIVYGPNDDKRGPEPSFSQVRGLSYDPAAHEVVYTASGRRTVCATVEESHGLFGEHVHLKNTGACVVTSEAATHIRDDGWALHRDKMIDTFLEVRQGACASKAGL